MDTRFLQYYERELRYIRELGAEFAQRFPKVAGRLGLSELECADPHVERLLEGFAFMAARVQVKLDAEYPRFTQHLMELVYPHYLAPTPSMAIVQFAPSTREGSLQEGFLLPRSSVLRARMGQRDVSACEYRTSRALQLWPIAIEHVEYSSVLRDLADVRLPEPAPARALLRIVLRATGGMRFDRLALDTLPLFVAGGDEIAARLHEALVTSCAGLVLRPAASTRAQPEAPVEPTVLGPACLRALGFDPDEALLPHTARSFHGYRLLQEYFAFPSRFSFVELSGLQPAVRRCASDRLELLIPLTRFDPALEAVLDASRLRAMAVPIINLFPRECDRIQLSERTHEHHVVPDRTRPLDYELHSITGVTAYATGARGKREFRPMYAQRERLDRTDHESEHGYYALLRRPRNAGGPAHAAPRSDYAGSEAFVVLTDADGGPSPSGNRQLGVSALCTNRDLPLMIVVGQDNDFSLQSGAPVEAVRCIVGPTAPRPAPLDGGTSWRLISHLSMNYQSLVDEAGQGSESLREMLALYAQLGDPLLCRHVEGVRSVASRPIVRPLPGPGPRSFGRGLEVTLECEEQAFQGQGSFMLASVLAAFFAKHAGINSFTETVLRTRERGEVYRWPTHAGSRHIL
jgi:type VI secretion system protein ImpG